MDSSGHSITRRRPSMDDSTHAAPRSRGRPSMDHSTHSMASSNTRRGIRRESMDHSGHYNPTRAIRRTSTDMIHTTAKTVIKKQGSREVQDQPYKRKYSRRYFGLVSVLVGRNPIRRLWLFTCILFGIGICLGRSVRITLDISSELTKHEISRIIDTVPEQEAKTSNFRQPNVPKRTLPFEYNFLFYSEETLHKERNLYRATADEILPALQELLEKAEAALESGPWSVTYKPSDSLAPSGDEHDYYHPAPYFWPAKRRDGTIDYNSPYEYRDGERIPGTGLFEKGSDRFDRSRLAAMQYNTTVLGLAYFLTGNEDYAEVAVRNIRVWFLNPATKMNANLFYSQVRRNHNKDNTGSQSGVIELKDLYFFLDAVQMVMGHLERQEVAQLRDWFVQYMTFLESSAQGIAEKKTKNNHGVYFDIQQLAVANFLGDKKRMERIWRRTESRVSEQVSAVDGAMPEELKRNTCEHYQMFTLQGWWTMARMGSNALNQKLWTANKNALCRASEFAIPYLRNREQCPGNSQREDDKRWWPLIVEAISHCPDLRRTEFEWRDWMSTDSKNIPINLYDMPRMYDVHDGVAPFWSLGMESVQQPVKPGDWNIKPELKKMYVRSGKSDTSSNNKSSNKKTKTTRSAISPDSDRGSTKKASMAMSSNIARRNDVATTSEAASSASGVTSSVSLSSDSGPTATGVGGFLVIKSTKTTTNNKPYSSTSPEIGNIPSKASQSSSPFPLFAPRLSSNQVFQKSQEVPRSSADPSDEYIPAILKKAARTSPKYQERVDRIKRWQKLGQIKIVQKMIKKCLDELIGSGFDR